MSLRYLFGPVSGTISQQKLTLPRQQGMCLTFGDSNTDIPLNVEEDWQAFAARWPAGFEPDFVALWPAYTTIPSWMFSAPIPVVALAADWNLLYHQYRILLSCCDGVLTDPLGVRTFEQSGWDAVYPASLFGCDPDDLQENLTHDNRDIDILFVGNLDAAVQQGRLSWLGRVAMLSEKYTVQIASGIFGEAYRSLMRRARIVFNQSIRGEANQRVFETLAAGALLFHEADNLEVPTLLEEGKEYLGYHDDDLEAKLEKYLQDESQRRTVAEAGFARASEFRFEKLWEQALEQIASAWPRLKERKATRNVLDWETELVGRTWMALSSTTADPRLGTDLESACKASSDSPLLAGLRAALLAKRALAVPANRRDPQPILQATSRALECSAGHPFLALNHVEVLFAAKQYPIARTLAQKALDRIDRLEADDPLLESVPHLPVAFDTFRVEWERAAWQNAGSALSTLQAKSRLLRWRLHMLLSEMDANSPQGLIHNYEAVLARDDLPTGQAALGCALGRAKAPSQAIPHLQRAVGLSPFERAIPRALYQALRETGRHGSASKLVHQRQLLHRAAPRLVGEEDWFSNPAPSGNELVSIVILCCNEVDLSRDCLESLFAHTSGPYELILIDNGSTDSTPQLLESIRTRSGPNRVEVVRNEENLGYPAGCNQGIARAQGTFVVFLNNDTVVTPRWLEGMLRWAAHRWPQVGMVGAVSNYAPDPQCVQPGYTSLDQLDDFAQEHARKYNGQVREFPRLTGFCLMVRRDVLAEVGAHDERYGLGFFDDDDLCVRVREKGYRLLIAQDVYIHHHGSRTFRSLGVDTSQQLEANFDLFRSKWGEERARPYSRPKQKPKEQPTPPDAAFAAIVADTSVPPQRVSLCLIVRNEEDNLGPCLESAQGLCEEIIVVDTGSTDRTKQIAADKGARLFDFPWCDSFSAARNQCLRHATGDWIFWMDADDRIDTANRAKLATLFDRLRPEILGYSMKCVCLPNPQASAPTVVDHIRLFPNHEKIRWEHRVHEQILPALRRLGGRIEFTGIEIQHIGYQDRELRKRKLQRDLRLLKIEREEMPEHPFTLFNLASVYRELGQHNEALPLLRRSLELSHPQDSIVSKLYALIAGCHRNLGQEQQALDATREGLQYYPEDAELLFLCAILLRDAGNLHEARTTLEQLLQGRERAEFRSVDAGIRSYKARHNLAVVLRDLGEIHEAESRWREALSAKPDFLPAWLGMAEMYLGCGRYDEVEKIARQVDQGLRNPVEATLLRGRSLLAQKEYASARATLETLTQKYPQVLDAWVFLSHVLLQEESDLKAAEKVLGKILELDPDHQEAKQNLQTLRARMARATKEG